MDHVFGFRLTVFVAKIAQSSVLEAVYELEVSFCVARDAAVPQSITCIVARD